MRTFKLWDKHKSASYDLSADALVSDVRGLGIKFNTIKTNGFVTAVETTYDPITLGLNFGRDTNAYTAFNQFMNFIRDNGRNKFILEYQANGRTIYADVWIRDIPKGQKTSYNMIQETLELERETHWYTLRSENIAVDPAVTTITNQVDDQIPALITIDGPANVEVTIFHEDFNSDEIGRVLVSTNLELGETLQIDGLNKKVKKDNDNAYHMINKAYDTFIILNPGVNKLRVVSSGATPTVTINYREWVID